ncbi:hypothetical protein [Pontibacter populi]|uniref:Glycosyltransferase subfamily 4-like N-terminal domain-containing protein n=1 Tax=Pontibacter populi TaxID=890055 RepID=A0ABV1RWV1_9BACT
MLIIGTVPPPIGGVSIHLERLIFSLKENGISYKFIDYRKMPLKAFYYFFIERCVHTNFSNKVLRFIAALIGYLFGKKVIITYHGKYDFTNFLDKYSLKLSFKSFVLNNYSYSHAVKVQNDRKVTLISAFIPPNNIKVDVNLRLDIEFTNFCRQYNYIFCTNSHSYVVDKFGRDIYGIDTIITAIKDFKEAGLIISDPSGKLHKIYSNSLPNVFFISYPHSFIEIIQKSNCVIRATTTDGDSLTIKEALYYKKLIIASDCVDRVDGVLLFNTGNVESLKNKMAIAITGTNLFKYVDLQDGSLSLISFYKSLIK